MKRKILVVDDEPLVRGFVERVLGRAGHHVVLARNGEEALSEFRSARLPFDLVIIDVVMPVKNGRDTFEELIALRPETRLLFMSAFTSNAMSGAFLRERNLPFLQKPFEREELLELVEMEIRELLDQYEFPGDDTPIIVGSALKALEGDTSDIGAPAVQKLVETLDEYIPEPERDVEKPFLMPIEDVFSISGRGTVVTGRVERGIIKVGEEIEIVGIKDTETTTCTGVEMFRKLLDEGRAGENVGVLLRGTKRDEVERGQVLAAPGTITPHTKFEAEVYILSKDEGGRHTPFFKGYRPQFYFRTTDVTGNVELPEGVEMVMPGDNIKMTVELIAPIAMDEGLRFAIREGGRTVGAGVVAKIIE